MAQTHSPATQAFFGWAKRAAIGAGRDRLTPIDLLCALHALEIEGLDPESRAVFGRGPGAPVPPQIRSLCEAAARVSTAGVVERRFSFDEVVREVVHRTHTLDQSLPLPLLLTSLRDCGDPLVRVFREIGQDAAAPGPVVASLQEVLDETERLGERLRATVLGQDHAVQMLCEGFFRARVVPPSGPSGIFTFLGPPGMGKTMLAEAFAAALGPVAGETFAYRRFDMSTMAGPQNFEQLFGAEQFYRGSKPGTLTGFVKENPRAVLLFDEIEKAHENTVQALLALLDKGEVVDKALSEVVSFRHAWFVFTTNLGREFFDSDAGSGILNGRQSFEVFDLLASARPRRFQGLGEAPAALPPEFVSRLAKGAAVLFQRLETRHFLELVARGLGAASEGPGGRPVPRLTASEAARIAFLLSLLPELDARRVVAATGAWASELLRASFDECRGALLADRPDSYSIEVECSPQARQRLDTVFSESGPVHALVIDDDAYMPDVITRAFSSGEIEVRHIGAEASAVDELARFRADFVLLDLSIGEGPTSARVDLALDILHTLRNQFPSLPVYVFSENPGSREAFDLVVSKVLRAGGARAYLPCLRDPNDALLMDDFTGRLSQVLSDVRNARLLRVLQRARKRFSFHVHYAWDRGAKTVRAALDGLADEVVVGATDHAAAVRFAGIPTERFTDVAGLDRAKRRLQQVREWLANPGTLGAFGVTPPRGFLLAGPPGTGKTMLARALAGEAGLPFLALAASELQSKYVGESEERIRELFDRARRYAPSIVFLDEIDAVAGRRESAQSDYQRNILDQLLASMDGFRVSDRPIFVLAATNHPEKLDPAIVRPGRFDETIPIDLPNARARQDFFTRRLGKLRVKVEADLSRLVASTAGCTPAVLDRVVREAVYRAAGEGRAVLTGDDLEHASRMVRFGATSEGIVVRSAERRVTAFHEAGHATVHLELFPDRAIDHLTIVPTEGGAMGFLAPQHDESRHDLQLDEVRAQLAVALAGREAQRLAGNPAAAITAGASSDLRQATGLAWRAITEWGFDEELGSVALSAVPAPLAGGASPLAHARLKRWLDDAAATAREVLERRRGVLEAIVDALLREESLDGDQVLAAAVRAGGAGAKDA